MNRKVLIAGLIAAMSAFVVTSAALIAAEYHVSMLGNDAGDGSNASPLRTISAAAKLAQPGDVITVHEGVYRERISPPRGGESDARRIVYQAAPGAKVVVKGSEIAKNWVKVQGDTWKLTLPNTFFGEFNPYSDLIHGDWYGSSRPNHTGAVYLDGRWLREAVHLDEVLKPAAKLPLWYAKVDGAGTGDYLVNIARIQVGGIKIPAVQTAAQKGAQAASCSEGGQCVGFIRAGDWLRYDGVDFGAGASSVELRVASLREASDLEIRLDKPDGELLGTAKASATGDWQKWTSISATIAKTAGKKNVCLVIKAPRTETDNTTIWAQFPGVNPNQADVEINVRQTVFTPKKTGINYITLRGFLLRHAATNWAPPTAGQIGLVSAYWCKGWIIENNDIAYSTCCGIALGKYSDEWDNRAESAEGYVGTLTRALKNGWNKATVGSHIVRNNHISHCEQTGVVGSLGCSFSTVTGNEIHDIHIRHLFGGAEMAGIKFHGAIDVIICGNHIYRCGDVSGIWLDWMAQGAQVTGNLLHDNVGDLGDIFCEMQHGPILLANNILLSERRSFALNAQGIAAAHNLITGPIDSMRSDTRVTPYQSAHATEVAGMYPAAQGDSGDDRFFNNLFVAPCSLRAIDRSILPCFAAGNVFTKGSQPSKFDTDALVRRDFDAGVKLTEKADGWYLAIAEDDAWRDAVKRKIVTTELLGKAKIPNLPYENVDGSPVRIDTDYFGVKRDEAKPFPGPFERPEDGKREIKVWPITARRS
ncbi:MAG: carbohydrate-binding protein [Thermoguttaceae bacterium]